MRCLHWLWLVGSGACMLACSNEDRTQLIVQSTAFEQPDPELDTRELGAGDPETGESTGNANPTDAASEGEPAADPPASEFVDVVGADFAPGPAPAVAEANLLPRIIAVSAPSGTTNGGRLVLRVTLEQPTSSPLFVVSVSGDTGYHNVQGVLVDAAGGYEMELQVGAEVQAGPLVVSVALTDGQGQVGEYHDVTVTVIQSGVGDVKVTLSFEPTHDLDLHVFEPGGVEISYRRKTSASGGRLDLDSGSNCTPSSSNAENIFWPAGAAPVGEYRVTVQNFEECIRGGIDFSVHVENGGRVDTYRNRFEAGTEGAVLDIVTFTH
jgi:hypothetical protein